jgi:hypothetical protein
MSTHSTHSTTRAGAERPTALALRLALAWAFVGVPLAYGVLETAKKAAVLFTG